MPQRLKFPKDQTQFFSTLTKRINTHFEEKNLSKHANGWMIAKTLFILTMVVSAYYAVVFGGFYDNIPLMLGLWAILGFVSALAPVNIGHDAIHGGYSSKQWVNNLMSHAFNFFGASAYMWSIMHNQAHHMYTNIDGHDEDMETLPIIRFSPAQKFMKIHKFQHLYAFLFYGLASVTWVLFKDYKKFFSDYIGGIKNNHAAKEYFFLFFYKAIYYTIFIVIPFTVIGQPWYVILGGWLLMHYIEGMTIAFIFMLAHLVEKAQFPEPIDDKGTMENSWAISQMMTTADFARKNWLAHFICGGLNFQIEHHLFPKICHIHYPHISHIVQETAEEFGVPFLDNPSFSSAMASHFRFMKAMGSGENPKILAAI